MTRYYFECKNIAKGLDQLTFVKHSGTVESMREKYEYEVINGKVIVTFHDVKRIISSRVSWGMRGYIFDKLQENGISSIYVPSDK